MENKVITIDAATGEVVEREMTEEELSHLALVNEQEVEKELAIQQKVNASESARKKLAKFGLTSEEINAIIGGV
jgi:hypothetical protein